MRLPEQPRENTPLPSHLDVQEGVPASRLTTLKVGGATPELLTAQSSRGLGEALERLSDSPPWLMLGAGSNLLIADEGVPPILRLGEAFQESRTEGTSLICGGAMRGATALRFAEKAGLSGLEPFGGMPGSVGGWAATNAGPAGIDCLDRVAWVEARARTGGRTRRFLPHEISRAYRTSPFRNAWVVEYVAFDLVAGKRSDVHQASRLARDHRLSSQPTGPSAGCIFRNPEGDAAGRLIDEAGFKGTTVGGASVSNKHANFILNSGGGTATEVWRLLHQVRHQVQSQFGVRLGLEVETFGTFTHA